MIDVEYFRYVQLKLADLWGHSLTEKQRKALDTYVSAYHTFCLSHQDRVPCQRDRDFEEAEEGKQAKAQWDEAWQEGKKCVDLFGLFWVDRYETGHNTSKN